MNKAFKLLRLSPADMMILTKLTVLFVAVRLGLTMLPFRRLRNFLHQLAHAWPHPRRASRRDMARIVGIARAISPYLLGDKPCLTNALVVQFLLERRGYPTVLRIGVAKKDGRALEAHAWLEYEGMVLIGGVDSPQRFTPFPPIAQEMR